MNSLETPTSPRSLADGEEITPSGAIYVLGSELRRGRVRRFAKGDNVVWFHTLGGGGGSGKRENEKEPIRAKIVDVNDADHVKIVVEPGQRVYYSPEGSWVRRDNVRPLHQFQPTSTPGLWSYADDVIGHYGAVETRGGYVVVSRILHVSAKSTETVQKFVGSTIHDANVWLTVEAYRRGR
jgi:hypothetical protein